MTVQRTPQDLCLLCKRRLSTKKNSHIFPRFWTRSLLGDDNQKEGYTVSSAAAKIGQKVQDSPKEDYIFCPECETRFSLNERYVANHFYNKYANPSSASDFPIIKNSIPDLDIMTARLVNPVMFKLFIYSLVWRASISNHPVFANFTLNASDEEKIRALLDEFLKDNDADTVANLAQQGSQFKSLPFNIVTTLESANVTANMIAPFSTDDGRILLFANEFMIIVYLDWNAPTHLASIYNSGTAAVSIGIVPLEEWAKYHTMMVQMLIGARQRNFGNHT